MTIAKQNGAFEVEFSVNEIRFIHQAFNEVCHGFRVADFDAKIGDMNVTKAEMEKLKAIYEGAQNKFACSCCIGFSSNNALSKRPK